MTRNIYLIIDSGQLESKEEHVFTYFLSNYTFGYAISFDGHSIRIGVHRK